MQVKLGAALAPLRQAETKAYTECSESCIQLFDQATCLAIANQKGVGA